MKNLFSVLLISTALPALGDETRSLDAHEHGRGALDIALDGQTLLMELRVPGADIVGFEYEATSQEDKDAIKSALTMLAKPMELFVFSDSAGCVLDRAQAALEVEEDHGDHDHGEEHDHGEDHADHDHDEEHDHGEDHADHDHGEEHETSAAHSEFHAEYAFTCENPASIAALSFEYFQNFENALALEVQIVTEKGAQAFEVNRDEPELDLTGIF